MNIYNTVIKLLKYHMRSDSSRLVFIINESLWRQKKKIYFKPLYAIIDTDSYPYYHRK